MFASRNRAGDSIKAARRRPAVRSTPCTRSILTNSVFGIRTLLSGYTCRRSVRFNDRRRYCFACTQTMTVRAIFTNFTKSTTSRCFQTLPVRPYLQTIAAPCHAAPASATRSSRVQEPVHTGSLATPPDSSKVGSREQFRCLQSDGRKDLFGSIGSTYCFQSNRF